MASLELQHLKKIYDGKVCAVQDFDLSIKDGEFIVLVGPSGCGKSTTLRMIAGLEDISEGKLLIDGKDVTNVAAKNRDIAMVFQNYALYSNMTVYENMAFSLTLRKDDPESIHRKVMEASAILGLEKQLNKKPKELSGGQRQRVAMGRAIVRNPKVFLFDEPLSNLDAKLRASMRREIKLLHHTLKTTMIYVTHDQTEALTLADRIVVMSMGKVQQIGTPFEIYHDPANAFVAYFIGNPAFNLFEGKIENGNFIGKKAGNILLTEEEKLIVAPYEGKTLLLGIRPEDFVEGGSYEFTVDLVEHLGQNSLIHGRLGTDKAVLKLLGWKRYQQGDKIALSLRTDKICFFDIDTGKRIRGEHHV
jgi:multiple sugar transport system ATP-binding protein